MAMLLGPRGAQFIAAGIAFSAFGFLAQSMLTAPRVYFAMAEDRIFFRSVAWVHPRTHVPVIAIALQGLWAIVIALTGTYAQVVNYVVAMDCIFLRPHRALPFCFAAPRWQRRDRFPRARSSLDDAALHRRGIVRSGEHVRA